MKKLLFITGLLLIGVNGFAKEKNKENSLPSTNVKEHLVSECCTATLTYNGAYVDHRTVCGMVTTGDNCNVAKQQVLDAHKEATITPA